MQHSVRVNEDFDIEVEIDGDIYYVSGSYVGSITYDHGSFYRSNGDPGDPPYYESELGSIYIGSCTKNDSEEELIVVKGSDLYDAIEAKCLELLDDVEIE